MNHQRRTLLQLPVAALGGLALSHPLRAQTAPSGPIRIVLPYPPGGSTDAITRFVADRLAASVKQSVVVENRPGAAGMIGAAAVAGAAPDGRTLLFTNTALIQSPLIQPKPLYDPMADFEPITLVAAAAQVFVANESLPVSNVREYVEYARKHPGLAYGSLGVGSTGHLYGELLKRKANLDIVHAAYKGDAPAISDLLAKQLPAGFVSTTMARTYGSAGRIKVLATLGSSRVPTMPDVPTFAESGFEGFEAIGWIGMLAPAKTPRPVVDRLSAEVGRIVRSPEGSKMLVEYGMLPQGGTAAEFSALLKRDQQVWQALVKQTGIKVE
jgi:tripartite-type tricarboxylate transporter receptor subunit TctC